MEVPPDVPIEAFVCGSNILEPPDAPIEAFALRHNVLNLAPAPPPLLEPAQDFAPAPPLSPLPEPAQDLPPAPPPLPEPAQDFAPVSPPLPEPAQASLFTLDVLESPNIPIEMFACGHSVLDLAPAPPCLPEPAQESLLKHRSGSLLLYARCAKALKTAQAQSASARASLDSLTDVWDGLHGLRQGDKVWFRRSRGPPDL